MKLQLAIDLVDTQGAIELVKELEEFIDVVKIACLVVKMRQLVVILTDLVVKITTLVVIVK